MFEAISMVILLGLVFYFMGKYWHNNPVKFHVYSTGLSTGFSTGVFKSYREAMKYVNSLDVNDYGHQIYLMW